MTPADATRWRTVREWFDELAELDPMSQAARLEALGASDPALRDEVASLLRADTEAEDRLAHVERILRTDSAPSSPQSRSGIDPLGLSGRVVSHFRVIEPIAIGGMGVVYRAEDTRLGRIVALKLPLPERFGAEARERFVRECRAAGVLDHPNVCTIHEVGESDDGYLYIAMPLYAGETLAARLGRSGPLELNEAIAITRAIARGVGAAHRAGVVHRDIKPANVMLLPDGSVRVLDFGLAKARDISLTRPGAMMGTVSYMAPEQLRDTPADARADLWAIGVVLYEMLTGQRPFSGDREIAVAYAILHDEPRLPSALRREIPTALDVLVGMLLEKDPDRRLSSTSELEVRLNAFDAQHEGTVQQSLTTAPAPRARISRRSQAIAVTTAAAIIVAGSALWSLRQPQNREKEFVVVADFETPPVDSQIADVLTDNTRRALSMSRSIGAVPDIRLNAVRQRLKIPAGQRLTREVARQIALGDGMRGVVLGSLKSFSGGYVIVLSLISATSNETIATVNRSGIEKDKLSDAIDVLTRQLRERAGDDAEAIRSQPSILALTSSSLQAMIDYVTALRLPRTEAQQAVALLKEAVTLDTGFASALWQYSKMMELGGSATASEHQALLARAWNHRERLTEYEQLRVEIAYRFSPDGVTPDMDAHRERLRQVVERYPNAIDAATLATFYLAEHDLPAAKRAFHRVIELDSTRLEGYAGLVGTLLWANQVRDARRVVDEIARRFPAALDVDVADVLVSYAERRLDHEREIVRRLKATAGPGRPLGYYVEANLELLAGHVEASERLLAERNALSPPSRFPLLPIPELGVSYWVRNRPELSLPMLNEFVARDTARHLGLDFAQSFAQFGLVDAAKALLAANGFPRRTIYSRGTDTLQTSAWIDFAQGRPREAAQKFRGSLRFSGGTAPSQSRLDAEIGLAFERAQLPDSAIAVYEHFLNAPASLEGDAIHLVPVLEHVAPLYEKRGDRRKARDAYARIAELWKTADPELQPRVAHARERAAALR